MKPLHVVKAAVAAGWGLGAALILVGWPVLAAVAVCVLVIAAGVMGARHGGRGIGWAKTRIRRLLERRIKTGGTVERV
jgi:hypothetical protein